LKRIFRILAKITLGLIILVVLILFGSYWYITTEWKRYYSEEEIKSFVKEIDKAPKLSDTFYGVYDKLHNNDRHKSMTIIYLSVVWNELFMGKRQSQTSWFVKAAYFFPKKKVRMQYSNFNLAWGLEKYTTPEKCFDFAMSIENIQLTRHDTTFKDITQIKDTTEILNYIVKTSSPTIYNKNPEKLNQRIIELRKKLNY